MTRQQLNEYENDFVNWLDLTEFTMTQGVHGFYLDDLQGVNLGGINNDCLKDAKQVFDRMDDYINDYLIEDLFECAESNNIEYGEINDLEDWLKCRKLMPDNETDFRFVDMICNHADDIDLSKVVSYLSSRHH